MMLLLMRGVRSCFWLLENLNSYPPAACFCSALTSLFFIKKPDLLFIKRRFPFIDAMDIASYWGEVIPWLFYAWPPFSEPTLQRLDGCLSMISFCSKFFIAILLMSSFGSFCCSEGSRILLILGGTAEIGSNDFLIYLSNPIKGDYFYY